MVSGPLPKSAQPVDAIYLIALWIETVFYGSHRPSLSQASYGLLSSFQELSELVRLCGRTHDEKSILTPSTTAL